MGRRHLRRLQQLRVIEHDVLIIGSGFGGQSAAIALREAGFDDFRILERRSFMGGTWCQNTYPGAAVDVQSPLYSLSSELYDWSQMFAEQDELRRYTEHVIAKHGLRERTELDANVTSLRWDGERGRWLVELEDGRSASARFVINASGPLSKAVVPDFEGLESYRGRWFHTNTWDHSYDYSGKRVAVIGVGASAAQVIPAIAPDVEELHVFMRTPHWVLPRPDHVFSPLERRLLRNEKAHRALRAAIYWSLETRVIGFKYSRALLDILGTRPALKHLREQVPDPDLRAKLTPDYTIGCKRVLVSNTLYPALCRDNVTLHDRTEAIARFTAEGIETIDGRHVPLDLVVFATGYDASDDPVSYEVVGRDSRRLREWWSEYPRAYLGTAMPSFPNLFVVTGPNTGIGHTSALFIIECQMQYIVRSIREASERGAASIEVRAEAEGRYTEMIHREMARTVWQNGGCHSWYQNKSGKVIAMFPGFSFTYRRLTRDFAAADHAFGGDFRG